MDSAQSQFVERFALLGALNYTPNFSSRMTFSALILALLVFHSSARGDRNCGYEVLTAAKRSAPIIVARTAPVQPTHREKPVIMVNSPRLQKTVDEIDFGPSTRELLRNVNHNIEGYALQKDEANERKMIDLKAKILKNLAHRKYQELEDHRASVRELLKPVAGNSPMGKFVVDWALFENNSPAINQQMEKVNSPFTKSMVETRATIQNKRDEITALLEAEHDALMHLYSTYYTNLTGKHSATPEEASRIAKALDLNLRLATSLYHLSASEVEFRTEGKTFPSVRFHADPETPIGRLVLGLQNLIPRKEIQLQIANEKNMERNATGVWVADQHILLTSPYLIWKTVKGEGPDEATLHEVRHAFLDALAERGVDSPYHGSAYTSDSLLPGNMVSGAYDKAVSFDEISTFALNVHITYAEWRKAPDELKQAYLKASADQAQMGQGIAERVALTNEKASERLQAILSRDPETSFSAMHGREKEEMNLFLGTGNGDFVEFRVITGTSGIKRVQVEFIIEGKLFVNSNLFGAEMVAAAETLMARNREVREQNGEGPTNEEFDVLIRGLKAKTDEAAKVARDAEKNFNQLRETLRRLQERGAGPNQLKQDLETAMRLFSVAPVRPYSGRPPLPIPDDWFFSRGLPDPRNRSRPPNAQ